jgi:glycosyltransferase involved in cell wall biosynthesis
MPDPLAALAVWYARPQGRLVLHWHSDVVRQRWSMHLYRPLQSWLLRRADAVIATSEAYAQSSEPLRSHLHKVKVVPLGAPPPHPAAERLVEEARRRHGGRRIIFSLGRMAYYKGFEVLIDASRQLPADAIVVIGGGGPDLAHYRALVEQRGAAGRVQFMGPMSPQRVEAYFAAADLFCMASTLRAEAYGLAVLEAMARGLPVVTTRIPGSGLGWLNRDGDTGLAVEPGDSDALAAALKRLLADEALRQRMGQAARQRWADGLTAMTMSDRILDIYSGLLAAPAPVADLGRHP